MQHDVQELCRVVSSFINNKLVISDGNRISIQNVDQYNKFLYLRFGLKKRISQQLEDLDFGV